MSDTLNTSAHSPRPADGYAAAPSRAGNGLGIASLILGILALLSSLLLAGLLFGSFALVFGLLELDRVARGEAKPHRGMAIAGAVLGVIAILISLAALGFRIWLIS